MAKNKYDLETQRYEFYMSEALNEAHKTVQNDDVPVGAIIVRDDIIIGKGWNQVERNKNSMCHAEIFAIEKALQTVRYKYLLNCEIYVTMEPCPMCAGAIVQARIPKLIYGASDPKAGSSGSLYNITDDSRLNHRCEIVKGVLEEECSIILKNFFKILRAKDK